MTWFRNAQIIALFLPVRPEYNRSSSTRTGLEIFSLSRTNRWSREGWKAIEKEWKSQAAMKLGGKVAGSDFHYTVGKDMAVVVNLETGENVDFEGKTRTVRIRATHVLQRKRGSGRSFRSIWTCCRFYVD